MITLPDHQMNMFEDFIGYQGSAVLDEPVQEENTYAEATDEPEKRTTGKYSAARFAGTVCEYVQQSSYESDGRGMPT